MPCAQVWRDKIFKKIFGVAAAGANQNKIDYGGSVFGIFLLLTLPFSFFLLHTISRNQYRHPSMSQASLKVSPDEEEEFQDIGYQQPYEAMTRNTARQEASLLQQQFL
jgi:hypothetical protein